MNTGAIKAKRKQQGVTQAQIAAKANITTTAYQRYESGDRVPNAHTAIAIAEALKIKSFSEFKTLFGAATSDNAAGDAQV